MLRYPVLRLGPEQMASCKAGCGLALDRPDNESNLHIYPLQGGSDSGFYYFRHWNAIDLFVYFSHHLVTIPPVGWIHAGHRHGVPVRASTGTAACRLTAYLLASLAWLRSLPAHPQQGPPLAGIRSAPPARPATGAGNIHYRVGRGRRALPGALLHRSGIGAHGISAGSSCGGAWI